MVVRRAKRNRKYLGTRRWGMGNIKNARGAGDRGGVGEVGRLTKHDFTYITAKAPWMLRKKGFTSMHKKTTTPINLDQISHMLKDKPANQTIDLRNRKVLSNGTLTKPATIKATAFSKEAVEKIKSAGGQAIAYEKIAKPTKPPAPAQAKA